MAKLPITQIDGQLDFADDRLREFRRTQNPHHRILYSDVDDNPNSYHFEETDQVTTATSAAQKEDRGNFIAFINSRKSPGDSRPAFQGKVTLPGQTMERSFALWAYTSEKTGNTVLSGKALGHGNDQIDSLARPQMEQNADATIQIAQRDGSEGLSIQDNNILLFKNAQKDAENPTRPDYWGYFNPGKGEPLMRLAAWTKEDRNGRAMLTGSLQKHEPDKEMDMDEPAPEPDNAMAPEVPRRRASHVHEEERDR